MSLCIESHMMFWHVFFCAHDYNDDNGYYNYHYHYHYHYNCHCHCP